MHPARAVKESTTISRGKRLVFIPITMFLDYKGGNHLSSYLGLISAFFRDRVYNGSCEGIGVGWG